MNIKKTMIRMGLVTSVAAGALSAAGAASVYYPPSVSLTKVKQSDPWSTDVEMTVEVGNDAAVDNSSETPQNGNFYIRISMTTVDGRTYVLHEFDQYDSEEGGLFVRPGVPAAATAPDLWSIPSTAGVFTVRWKPDRELGVPQELFKDAKFKAEGIWRGNQPTPYTSYIGFWASSGREPCLRWEGNNITSGFPKEGAQCIYMRRIPAGTFRMGHMVGKGEYAGFKDVTLTNDFYMSTTNITKGILYDIGDTKHGKYNSSEAAVGLTYEDLRGNVRPDQDPDPESIIGKLRVATGLPDLDLPTLAQYRYACSGGRRRLSMVYPDYMLEYSVNDAGHMVVKPYSKFNNSSSTTVSKQIQNMIAKYLSNRYVYDYTGALLDMDKWAGSGSYAAINIYEKGSARMHTWELKRMLADGASYVRDRASGTEGFSEEDFAALGTVNPLLTASGENSHPLWAGSPSYAECGRNNTTRANWCYNDCYYQDADPANIGFRLVCTWPGETPVVVLEPKYKSASAPVTATVDLRDANPLWSWNKGDAKVRLNCLPRWGHALTLRYDQLNQQLPSWLADYRGNLRVCPVSDFPESLDDYNTWGWADERNVQKTDKDIPEGAFPGPGLYEVWDKNGDYFELLLWSPLSVKIDKARQRYPWNGKIDVDYTSENGDRATELELVLTANGQEYTSTAGNLSGVTTCGGVPGCKESEDSDPTPAGPQQHRITWDAAADGATDAVDKNATLILRAKKK